MLFLQHCTVTSRQGNRSVELTFVALLCFVIIVREKKKPRNFFVKLILITLFDLTDDCGLVLGN